jgi:uncharacterized protein (TIGR02246 family)
MKRIVSFMMLAVAAMSLASCANEKAASSTTARPAENVEQAIFKMESDWADSFVKNDMSVTERITADDYSFINSAGETQTKSQLVEMFKSGTYKITYLDLDNLKVRVFGDTAVATYGQTEKSEYKGKDNSGHYVYTDVWVKRDGNWLIVATQGTKSEHEKT